MNYINNNNQFSFLQSEHKKTISFNPFGFLLKKNKLSNYEKADAFKTCYNSIKNNSEIKDDNMIDKSQYVNSTLLPQLIATEFSKEKNILLFISNIKQFIVISETLVEDLKENATLFNAFVYLVNVMLLNEKLFPKKNVFPEIMSILSNELKFIFDNFSGTGSV